MNFKDDEEGRVMFTLIGLAACVYFQKCLATVDLLCKKLPGKFSKPCIRPMLEFDWKEYLVNAQREFGGRLWCLEKPFVLFANEEIIGDDDDLDRHVAKVYQMTLRGDYELMAQKNVCDIFSDKINLGRKFVFLTFSINARVVGSLIIMLYYDLCPKTCKSFLKKCKDTKKGYKGQAIHRIMQRSWIQCGGFELPLESRSCENYKIPHNRRGILSMCNNGCHKDNRTQFLITLNPTPWMNYRYVAFGQIVQGENVLRHIENRETIYEAPKDTIAIENCGELTLEDNIVLENYPRIQIRQQSEVVGAKEENADYLSDKSSELLPNLYKKGLYCFPLDGKQYLPSGNLFHPLFTSPGTSESGEEWRSDGKFYKEIRKLVGQKQIRFGSLPTIDSFKLLDNSTQKVSSNYNSSVD